MFHLILSLFYTIPGLYTFIRIWQLFIEKRYRLWYVLIYGLLFSAYPLNMLLEGNHPGAAQLFDYVADYMLPFFLYLFLFVLLTDILLLINLVFRIIPKEVIRKRSVRNKSFIAVILFTLAVIAGGIINLNTIRISEYNIEVPAQSSKLKKLRIVFVSDFHLEKTVPDKFVRKFAEKVKAINPDLMLYGGDILEGDGEKIAHFEEILRELAPQYGSFAVPGNHDRIGMLKGNHFFSRSGIVLLRDSIAVREHAFAIAGREEARYRRKSAGAITSEAPGNLPLIVVDHRPTEPDQLSMTRADIVFSGHTHNGQMFPINLNVRHVYQLAWGYMKKRNTHFFVSSGIRLWGPPVRTTGISEIMVVNVTFI